MDAAEFVEVGGKIVTIGGQLETLRAEREVLDGKIKELEKELLPLLGRHSALLASLTDSVAPKAQPPPLVVPDLLPRDLIGGDEKVALARRIKGFLNNAEPGTSATQIAEALKVDPALVREAMRSL